MDDFGSSITDKSLVYDRRSGNEDKAGLHFLIATVSSYPFLAGGATPNPAYPSLTQLNGAALSGFALYSWILQQIEARCFDENKPVKTIRFLASPTTYECGVEPLLLGMGAPCTTRAFRLAADGFRRDAAADADGLTFLHFVGHGFRRDVDDAAMLFHEFGDSGMSPLTYAASLKQIISAMAPASGDCKSIARTQVFLSDSCRTPLDAVKNLKHQDIAPILDEVNPHQNDVPDDRTVATVFSCGDYQQAQMPNGLQSVFSNALMDCLNCDGAILVDDDAGWFGPRREWHVTVKSLAESLPKHFKSVVQPLTETEQDPRTIVQTGAQLDATVCFLAAAPPAEVILCFEPHDQCSNISAKLCCPPGNLIFEQASVANPQLISSTAGYHELHVGAILTSPDRTVAGRDFKPIPPRMKKWNCNFDKVQSWNRLHVLDRNAE